VTARLSPASPAPLRGGESAAKRAFGWNGVRATVPAAWDPLTIGQRYLLLGCQGKPTLEVRWQPGSGSGGRALPLRRILRRLNRSSAVRITAAPWPRAWEGIAWSGRAEAFDWQEDRRRGAGVLLACGQCGGAALMRFFETHHGAQILSSFRDHPDGDRHLWALFDIRIWLPRQLSLMRYRFESGRFDLAFHGRGYDLRLLRWAPADVLLGRRALADFIATTALAPPPGTDGGASQARGFLQWSGGDGSQAAGRLLRWLGIAPRRRWLRCWHQPQHNRILGLMATGRRLPAPETLEALCRGYETL
jgi:hypothetical protein